MLILGLLIVIAAALTALWLFSKRDATLRIKIRIVMRNHPRTLQLLKRGNMGLRQSLKERVLRELVAREGPFENQNHLERLIDSEVAKLAPGSGRFLRVGSGILAGFACLLVLLMLTFGSSDPGEAAADTLLEKARLHIDQREYTAAKELLDQILTISPDHREADKLRLQMEKHLVKQD